MDKYRIKLFYAEWCGHCKNFKPEWEKFKKFISENSVIKDKNNKSLEIKTEEFDDSKTSELETEQVVGFPTIVIYKNDVEKRDIYSGQRTLDGLKKYFNIDTQTQDGGMGYRYNNNVAGIGQGSGLTSNINSGYTNTGTTGFVSSKNIENYDQKGGFRQNDAYYEKYLKYKMKYLKLKKQL